MTQQQLLKRKIVLKKQAIKLFIEEIEDLNERLQLLKMRQRFESRIEESFDSEVSRRLDCVNFLLEEGADNG